MAKTQSNDSIGTETATVAAKGLTFKAKKSVSLPSFALPENLPVILQVNSAIYTGEQTDEKMPAPHFVEVTIIQDNRENGYSQGEVGVLTLPTVIYKDLNRIFPENTIIGEYFEITSFAKKKGRSGNDYRPFKCINLELA
jgi:hypothetical protein